MARAQSMTDPAKDAGALLRRLGFVVLVLAMPGAALLFRRGVVMLVPIGIVLLILGAALDSGFRPLRESLDRLTSSAGIAAAALGIVWAAASLSWTADPAFGAERLMTIVGSVLLGLAGYLALPDRTRSANLYLVPIGVVVASLLLIGLRVSGHGGSGTEEDGPNLDRGLAVVVLLLWPGVAWLRTRHRTLEGLGLVILVAGAAWLAWEPWALLAVAAGALAFAAASIGPRAAASGAGLAVAAVIALTPALPFAPAALLRELPWPPGTFEAAEAWGAAIRSDPVRLLTGHGFGSFVRHRLTGILPAQVLDTLPVRIWYELGMLGALTAALAIWTGLRSAVSSYAPLLPGLVAAFCTAVTLAALGIGSNQAWWPSALSILVLAFVAAERGQFRTRRPAARELAAG